MTESRAADTTLTDYDFTPDDLYIRNKASRTSVSVETVRYDEGDANDPYDLYVFGETVNRHKARLELVERRLVECAEDDPFFTGMRGADGEPLREEFSDVASHEFDAQGMNETDLEAEVVEFISAHT